MRYSLSEGPSRHQETTAHSYFPSTGQILPSARQSRLHTHKKRLKENKTVPRPLNQMTKHDNYQDTIFFPPEACVHILLEAKNKQNQAMCKALGTGLCKCYQGPRSLSPPPARGIFQDTTLQCLFAVVRKGKQGPCMNQLHTPGSPKVNIMHAFCSGFLYKDRAGGGGILCDLLNLLPPFIQCMNK